MVAGPIRSGRPPTSLNCSTLATRIAGATVLVARMTAIGTATATQAPSHLANIARPGELEVRMLGVVASARGKGVARALMGWCEAGRRARNAGGGPDHEPNMTQARRLYEGLGYLRTPQRD